MNKKRTSTSWQKVSKWYNQEVGTSGHYYHQHVIFPGINKLIKFSSTSKVLDLACGQGVLARNIDQNIPYLGLDLSSNLINQAKKQDSNTFHQYQVADLSKKIQIKNQDFSHAFIILALQNIEFPAVALKNAYDHLLTGGQLLIVLNHPCFRIPRQSSWEIDQNKKIQYRRIDKYLSFMKIPISAHPGSAQHSPITWSFHFSISDLSNWLFKVGFKIIKIEEWGSDKVSEGKAAKMENRSRQEFPLFMAVLVEK